MNLNQQQWEMLKTADKCSLPGDGLRIKGRGPNATGRALEARGLVRVVQVDCSGRVHITEVGRMMLLQRDPESQRVGLGVTSESPFGASLSG